MVVNDIRAGRRKRWHGDSISRKNVRTSFLQIFVPCYDLRVELLKLYRNSHRQRVLLQRSLFLSYLLNSSPVTIGGMLEFYLWISTFTSPVILSIFSFCRNISTFLSPLGPVATRLLLQAEIPSATMYACAGRDVRVITPQLRASWARATQYRFSAHNLYMASMQYRSTKSRDTFAVSCLRQL